MQFFKKINKFSNTKFIFASLILFLSVFIVVNFVFPSDIPYLTQTFNYSYTQAYQVLTDMGSDGRHQHLLVLISDVLMVIFYSVFLSTSICAIFRNLFSEKNKLNYLVLLPFVLAGFQIIEIIDIFFMVSMYPNSIENLYVFTNIITMIKTILTTICFLIPIIGIIPITIIKFKKKINSNVS